MSLGVTIRRYHTWAIYQFLSLTQISKPTDKRLCCLLVSIRKKTSLMHRWLSIDRQECYQNVRIDANGIKQKTLQIALKRWVGLCCMGSLVLSRIVHLPHLVHLEDTQHCGNCISKQRNKGGAINLRKSMRLIDIRSILLIAPATITLLAI